jgi:hypothetical protein
MFAVRNFSHLQVWDTRKTENPVSVQEVQSFPDGVEDAAHDRFGSLFTESGDIYSGMFGQSFICWNWKKSIVIKHKATRRATNFGDTQVDVTKKVSGLVTNHSATVLGLVSTSALFFYQLE